MNQLQLTEQINITDLMTSLQQQHKDLLNAQLASLRQAFLTRLPQELLVSSNIVQVAPDAFEVHVNEEECKGEGEVVTEEHFVNVKEEGVKEHSVGEPLGVGATEHVQVSAPSDLVSPCLVMCVQDGSVKQASVPENITEQNLVIAEMDSEATIASAEETLAQNGQGDSQHDIGVVLEESDSEPVKKRLRHT